MVRKKYAALSLHVFHFPDIRSPPPLRAALLSSHSVHYVPLISRRRSAPPYLQLAPSPFAPETDCRNCVGNKPYLL